MPFFYRAKIMVRIIAVFLIISSLWAASSAAYIEYKNAKADYFLPRQDVDPDGGWIDGTWRITAAPSKPRDPRDSLRIVVQSFGLIQYPLCLGILIVAILSIKSSRLRMNRTIRWCSCISCLIAVICFGLAIYRGYFESLG